jgi:hypothetical protein
MAATALLVTSIIGTVAGVAGQISSGISQQRQIEYNRQQTEYNQRLAQINATNVRQMADYNAELERRQAAATRAAGEMAANEKAAQGRRLGSTQQALYDAAGVDSTSGSPLTVMAETAANVERDILTTKYNYEVKALQADSQADLWDFKGMQEANVWNLKAQQMNNQGNRGNSALWGGLLGGAMEAFKGAGKIFGSWGESNSKVSSGSLDQYALAD